MTTDRQTSPLAGSDRHVLGVRYEASPRALCHRNPHPRGTVARGTVAGSGCHYVSSSKLSCWRLKENKKSRKLDGMES